MLDFFVETNAYVLDNFAGPTEAVPDAIVQNKVNWSLRDRKKSVVQVTIS